MGGDKQKEETIHHRQLALIDDWPEAVRRVHREVRYCHLARGDECCDAGEQTGSDQQAGGEFNNPANQELGMIDHPCAAQHAEELLRAVTGEEKPKDDAGEGEGQIDEGAATICHSRSMISDRQKRLLAPPARFFQIQLWN